MSFVARPSPALLALAVAFGTAVVSSCAKKGGAPAPPDGTARPAASDVPAAADATADDAADAGAAPPDAAGRIPSPEELQARPCWDGADWVVRPETPAADPPARCGGMTAKPLAEVALPLLDGRLEVHPLDGAQLEGAAASVMGAPEPSPIETRVFLEADGEKLVLMAWELFRTAGDRFDLGVHRDVATWRTPPGVLSCVEPLTVADDRLQAYAVVPSAIHGDGDAMTTLSVFVLHPDGLVQFLRFYVNPPLVPGGAACIAAARRVAASLAAGARQLERAGGKRRLDAYAPTRELELELPADYVLTPEPGPDFVVYQVEPIVPLGAPSGRFGVYLGDHPQQPAEGWSGPADRVQGPLLGERVEWVSWDIPATEEGPEQHRTEALMPLASFPGMGGFLHAFAWAEDSALLVELRAVLRTMKVVPKPER
ncbi:MAG: hypothetical protein HY905_27990 [Deltaproteobacteria bacterium]|nr:hypothetical protein [Deltaproteobacteria bacterium]